MSQHQLHIKTLQSAPGDSVETPVRGGRGCKSRALKSLPSWPKPLHAYRKCFRQLFFEQTCNDYTFKYTQIIIRELFVVVACNEPPHPPKRCLDAETTWDQSVLFRTFFHLDLLLLAKEHGGSILSWLLFRQMFNALFPRNGVTVGGVGARIRFGKLAFPQLNGAFLGQKDVILGCFALRFQRNWQIGTLAWEPCAASRF